MSKELPAPVEEFKDTYPDVWKTFTQLGHRCHEAGPLDEKTRRLVKSRIR
jgi:4-carboxymuconolactone decarboxylase